VAKAYYIFIGWVYNLILGHNSRQALQAKLNKTTKFSRKPGTAAPGNNEERMGSNSKNVAPVCNEQTRINGHNYNASINFR